MLIKTHLQNMAVKALCESMSVKTMVQLVQEFLPDYNLHDKFGFRESISIPTANAAKQIIEDICGAQLFPQFVQLLIKTQNTGFRGRKYPIAYLAYIIHNLQAHGYLFDAENNMFLEDPRVKKSINWGVLREGVEYEVTFLRFDISGNSQLVRTNPAKAVERTYQDLFCIVNAALDRRNGRMWSSEGDGGLAAFCFSKKDMQAVLSAVEMLHELFLYNKLGCVLDAPLQVRLAVHSGKYTFSFNTESLKKSDSVKEISDIETKFTKPGSITISSKILTCLDKRIADLFTPCKGKYTYNLYNYEVCLES